MTEYVSPLAKRIAARERKIHEFDVAGFFKLTGEAIPKLGIRAPVKSEQDAAIISAHMAAAVSTKAVESAKSDEDILRDLKSCHILHKCCLDPTPQTKANGEKFWYPAFPSPGWMADHLSTEQIGVLINLVNEVRRVEGPEPNELDDATVDTFHDAAVQADADTVAVFLAGCGREFMVQLYLAEAKRLADAHGAIATMQAEIDDLKTKATQGEQAQSES